MAELQLAELRKVFGKTEIIHGVDLLIGDGDFIVFVGPSGCGKSTLLRLIAGLEDITSGELLIDGKKVNDVPPAQRGNAMVFQSYALYPHFSVFDNMAFGLQIAGEDKQDIRKRVKRAAETLQITDLLDRKPRELSGGQRQRVAIGRAIVREPGVFLFDEPLSNLDAALRVQMRIEISRLHKKLKATMIYVTHDQVEAMTLADRIVVLNKGNVEQVGSPLELYHYPKNMFVAGFIGSPKMNFLNGTLFDASENYGAVKLKDGTQIRAAVQATSGREGGDVDLGIRPEHLEFGDDSPGNLPGEVLLVEHLGERSLIYVLIPAMDEPLTVQVEGTTNKRAGDTVHVRMPEQLCHLFGADGEAFRRQRVEDTVMPATT